MARNMYFVSADTDLSKVKLTAKGANVRQTIDGKECDTFTFVKDGVRLMGINVLKQAKTVRKVAKK